MFAANGTIGTQSTIMQSIIRARDFFGDETTRAQRDRANIAKLVLGSAEWPRDLVGLAACAASSLTFPN
jgi:hypothetical protein